MASPHPAAMYWGNTNVAIYNESYIHIAGRKHPELMGQSYNKAWSEIWDEIKGVFEEAKTSGLSTMKADDCLMLNRNGFVEETYFSWSIIPIVGDSGEISGLYNPCFEHTKRKVAERRMLTLREIGERVAIARDTKNFWKQVLKGLDYNPEDTPFVLLYSIATDDQGGGSETSSIQSSSLKATKQCLLEGSLGVPEGHDAAPLILDPNTDDSGWCSYFKASMKDGTHIVLDVEKGTLAPSLLDGIEFRGFGERCRSVVISPVQPTSDDSVLGFLVMGINPRRPYDDEYDLFVQLLTRQLATAMASVVLFEEEIRRGERAAKLAAIDRMELHEQLAARTQEAVDSETKFTRMAEFAPVGMFIANSEGKLTFCNDTWYKITGHPRDGHHGLNWMDSVKDEDREIVEEMWNKLINKKEPANREFRFKVRWEARNGSAKGDTWVLASAYPEKAENGSLKSVFGSITNISQQKWAEDVQKQRTEEAVEMKRQQGKFRCLFKLMCNSLYGGPAELEKTATCFCGVTHGVRISVLSLAWLLALQAGQISLHLRHSIRCFYLALTRSGTDFSQRTSLILPVMRCETRLAQYCSVPTKSQRHSAAFARNPITTLDRVLNLLIAVLMQRRPLPSVHNTRKESSMTFLHFRNWTAHCYLLHLWM